MGNDEKGSERTPPEVFARHLELREAMELERDISENYTEDCVILSRAGILKGHEGVRAAWQRLQKALPDARFSYRTLHQEDKYGFLEWEAEGQMAHIPDGADTFVIRDGKICMHSIHYTVKDGVLK